MGEAILEKEKNERYKEFYRQSREINFSQISREDKIKLIKIVYRTTYGTPIEKLGNGQLYDILTSLYERAEKSSEEVPKGLESEVLNEFGELKTTRDPAKREALIEKLGIQLAPFSDNNYLVREYVKSLKELNI